MPNYEDLCILKSTRRNSVQCNCYICLTGHFYGHPKVEVGRGLIGNTGVKIDDTNGLKGNSNITKLPPMSTKLQENKSKNVNLIKSCNKCFQKVGRGIRHPCSDTIARNNVCYYRIITVYQKKIKNKLYQVD